MRIAVVHPDSGWILTRLAQELCKAASDRFFLANLIPGRFHFSGTVDAIYYMDAQNCWGSPMRDMFPGVFHVAMFTHADLDDLATVRPDIQKLDGVVHMCQRYYERFLKAGFYPKERMTVIAPGEPCSLFKLRPLRLGVCQRGGFPGKGDPFLFEALARMPVEIRRHVGLHIKGSGWGPSLEQFRDRIGPMRVAVDDDERPQSYEDFYEAIDYLLIPSLWEGGPMALQEAMACGVPVIAADVGFVPDFLRSWDSGAAIVAPGCRLFPPGNREAMANAIESRVRDRMDLRSRVEGLTWRSYAEKLEAFVETVRGL